MIVSNLTESEQSIYTSYISRRYDGIWRTYTLGNKVIPVIGKTSIENLFNITFSKPGLPLDYIPGCGFSPYCDINGPVYSIDEFKAIAYEYNLTKRKTFIDLKVAHSICRYNAEMVNRLVLLADDMYNAQQLHEEFKNAVVEYLKKHALCNVIEESTLDVSIKVDSRNAICYKELLDYLHYNGEKPVLDFKYTIENDTKVAHIGVDNYSANFSETSYNISLCKIENM